MALYTPQVLGAGHGALGLDFDAPLGAPRSPASSSSS